MCIYIRYSIHTKPMPGSYSGLCHRIWSCYTPHKSEKWFLGTVREFYLDELDLATDVTTLTISLIAGLEDMGYSSPPALRKKIQQSILRHPLLWAPESHPIFFPEKEVKQTFNLRIQCAPLFLGIDSDDIVDFVWVCILLTSMNVCVYIYTTQHEYRILREYDVWWTTSHDLTPKGSWGGEIPLFQANLA